MDTDFLEQSAGGGKKDKGKGKKSGIWKRAGEKNHGEFAVVNFKS